MKISKKTQTGFGSAAYVTLVAALAVLAIVALALYAKNNPLKAPANTPTNTTGQNATSTASNNSNSSTSGSTNNHQTASVITAYPSGPYYHNNLFGLSVPGIYVVQNGALNSYGNVAPTASYDFYYTGVKLFTINVFSKEEWNNIRIQETVQSDAGTKNAYLGEGHYLGENKTWIYSFEPSTYAVPPSGILFY